MELYHIFCKDKRLEGYVLNGFEKRFQFNPKQAVSIYKSQKRHSTQLEELLSSILKATLTSMK